MNFDTRPTDDIEPMIPPLPTTERRTPTDQRSQPTSDRPTPERPTDTTYATSYTRDYEEIEPGVPRMR
ncbi:MAG: hypothetical protein ABEJ78_11340 [Haloferacaceae archaeon]